MGCARRVGILKLASWGAHALGAGAMAWTKWRALRKEMCMETLYPRPRTWRVVVVLALMAGTMWAGGCAILAGGAAGAATGYIAGNEAAKNK